MANVRYQKIFRTTAILFSVSFFILLPLKSDEAKAATYYIDPSCATPGNGTGMDCDGSANSPFDQWSDTAVTAGNTYLQKAGTTAGESVTIAASNVNLGKYGAGVNPIITGSGIRTVDIIISGAATGVSISDFTLQGATQQIISMTNASASLSLSSCTLNVAAGSVIDGANYTFIADSLTMTDCTTNLSGSALFVVATNPSYSYDISYTGGIINDTFSNKMFRIYSSGSYDISHNTVNLNYASASYSLISVSATAISPAITFSDNEISLPSGYNSTGSIISILGTGATFTSSGNAWTVGSSTQTASLIAVANAAASFANDVFTLSGTQALAPISITSTGTAMTPTLTGVTITTNARAGYALSIGTEDTGANNDKITPTITGCRFYGPNRSSLVSNNSTTHGVLIGHNKGATFTKNISKGFAYGVVFKHSAAAGGTISDCSNNQFIDNMIGLYDKGAGELKAYNNTVVSHYVYDEGVSAGRGIYINDNSGAHSPENVIAKNNLVYVSSSAVTSVGIDLGIAAPSGFEADYNLVYLVDSGVYGSINGTSYGSLSDWRGAGYGTHDKSADPLFVSASDHNLSPASPAVDSGTVVAGLNADFSGNPVAGIHDIGAFEYQPRAIASFSLNGLSPNVPGVIDENAKTITLSVPFGTAVNALVPTIVINGASVSPATGVARNFTAPVTYTVTAVDGNTQDYTITVVVAASGSIINPARPAIVKVEVVKVEGNVVTLSLSVSGASLVALSDSPDFEGASWEPYASSKVYDKKTDQKKIYIKFISSNGGASPVSSLDIPVSVNEAATAINGSAYPDGVLLKLSSSPKVYVVIAGKKKWISTPEVFEQLGYEWKEIKVVSSGELDKLSDNEDNLIRPTGGYKVYLVVNGVKRHIPNPQIFLDYGFSWTDVKEVSEAISDTYKDSFLLKESGSDGVYYVNSQGVRKLIPDDMVFKSYANAHEDVQIVSKLEMESYPLSDLIRLDGDDDTYLITGRIKKLIPSVSVFDKHGFDWNLVTCVNRTEFDWYQDGEALK